ncbi:MAG: pyridoxamine 5'-phosphate oxidase family protein [Firmicutes bacterium]|nr:pyridoxamine 5'-phosphate oxidase family protein [Bacillota bacterium]
MDRYDRYIYDPKIISAILDICPIAHIGFQDKNNAYVLPFNYGYSVSEDKLRIFIHTAKNGYKLRLIEKNPVVCCEFDAWFNFPDRPYKGHVHDFRSVIAFGKMRLLDLKTETGECRAGMQELFRKYHRTGCQNPEGMNAIRLYVIECDWEDVSAKTETPVRTPEDVPFPDVYGLPEDMEPFDISDLLEEREDRVRNRRYLGYLEEDE